MHDHLKDQVELMGYKPENVAQDTTVEQDFLIMSRLMRITRTSDFSDEELEQYKLAAASAVEDVRYVMGSRILTPDFSQEELTDYQWSAEHPTGSCRGFRLTDELTDEEVKNWQETLEWLNKLDLIALRAKVVFEREEPEPVVRQGDEPYNSNSWERVVAACNLGNDPYSVNPNCW